MLEFVIVLLIVGLMLVVSRMVLLMLGESEQARTMREAEQRIIEINRQAQAAILEEALRRARARPTATRLDRLPPNLIDNSDGRYGPWND